MVSEIGRQGTPPFQHVHQLGLFVKQEKKKRKKRKLSDLGKIFSPSPPTLYWRTKDPTCLMLNIYETIPQLGDAAEVNNSI